MTKLSSKETRMDSRMDSSMDDPVSNVDLIDDFFRFQIWDDLIDSREEFFCDPLTESQVEKILEDHSDKIKASAMLFLEQPDVKFDKNGKVIIEMNAIMNWCHVGGFTMFLGKEEYQFFPEGLTEIVFKKVSNNLVKRFSHKFSQSQLETIIDGLSPEILKAANASIADDLDRYNFSLHCNKYLPDNIVVKFPVSPPLLFETCRSCIKKHKIDTRVLPKSLQ